MVTESSLGEWDKPSSGSAASALAALSPEALALCIEQAPAALLVADAPDVRIRLANAAALHIRGMTALRLIGIPLELHARHWRWVQPGGSWCPAEEFPLARAVLRGERSTDVELILRRDDGEERWILASAAPLHDADGRIRGGIMSFADITSWRESQQALRESEARYRAVVEDQGEFIVRWRPDGTRTFVNAAYARFFGSTRAELEGTSFMPLISAEDRDRVQSRLLALTPESPVSTGEHRVIGPDGSVGWQQWTDRALFDARGELIEMQSTGRVITERVESELALARRERELARAQSVAHVGSFIYDVRADRGLLSDEAMAMLGVRERPISMESFARILHPEDRERVVAEIRRGLRQGAEFAHEYRVVRPDGSICHVSGRAQIARNPLGEPVEGLVTLLDVTEDRQREAALADALAQLRALKARVDAENVHLREQVRRAHGLGGIVGDSPAIRACLAQVEQVATTAATVLVQGETGTGKELVARAIHERGPRAEAPFVAVSCAALPDTLIESELFGYEKGAFTGADRPRIGCFELAHSGTLFLDEIGEFPLRLQPKLLRALQEREVQRLGSERRLRVDVRVIAATNRDLAQMVAAGEFRSDLYYRLNVFPIVLPPLRERREDILLLAEHFLRKLAPGMGRSVERISDRAKRALLEHAWPGNVRELHNVIERALVTCTGPVLDLELSERQLAGAVSSRERGITLAEVEAEHLAAVLEATGWTIEGPGGAAVRLGLKPSTLRSRLRKLGIARR